MSFDPEAPDGPDDWFVPGNARIDPYPNDWFVPSPAAPDAVNAGLSNRSAAPIANPAAPPPDPFAAYWSQIPASRVGAMAWDPPNLPFFAQSSTNNFSAPTSPFAPPIPPGSWPPTSSADSSPPPEWASGHSLLGGIANLLAPIPAAGSGGLLGQLATLGMPPQPASSQGGLLGALATLGTPPTAPPPWQPYQAQNLVDFILHAPREIGDVAHVFATPELRGRLWDAWTGANGQPRQQLFPERLVRNVNALIPDILSGRLRTPGFTNAPQEGDDDGYLQRAQEGTAFALPGWAPKGAITSGLGGGFRRLGKELGVGEATPEVAPASGAPPGGLAERPPAPETGEAATGTRPAGIGEPQLGEPKLAEPKLLPPPDDAASGIGAAPRSAGAAAPNALENEGIDTYESPAEPPRVPADGNGQPAPTSSEAGGPAAAEAALQAARAAAESASTPSTPERLQMHVDNAVARLKRDGLTANQKKSLNYHPRYEAAHKGERIDSFAKESIAKDENLRHLKITPRFQFGPDIYDPVNRVWYDITTREQWNGHEKKYTEGFGQGTPLYYGGK